MSESNYVIHSSLNEDIDRIEATLHSLGEELKRLKAKQQKLRHKFKLDATELLEPSKKHKRKKSYHNSDDSTPKKKKQYVPAGEEIREQDDKPTKKIKRSKEEVSSEEDKTVSLVEDQTKLQKNTWKKHIAKDDYSLESTPTHSKGTISLQRTDSEYLIDRIEEIESMSSEITEQKYAIKYTQSCSPQLDNFNNKTKNAESFPQFSTWKQEKISLRDKLKNGVLRLDFHGSNIAKIPGYGERVHLNELY